MIPYAQSILIQMLSPLIRVSNRFSQTAKYRIITSCFIVDIILFCIIQGLLRKTNYFYNTCCGVILLFVIIFMSLDKQLVQIRWRRSMWIAWFGMCIAFTISDLFVFKQTCGLGIVLGIVFPILFFVWQNHSRRDLLWKCFKDALKIAFLIIVILAMLFRPFAAGGRYAAIFTNPNTFGLYLYLLFCVYISDLDWFVETDRPLKKKIWVFIQIGMVIFYISISQARTAMLAVGAVFITWLICRGIINVQKKVFLPFLKNIALVILVTIICYPVLFKAQAVIPNFVNHPLIFAEDKLFMSNGEKIEVVGKSLLESKKIEGAKKELVKDNVIVRTINSLMHLEDLDRISSGRISIYKVYISQFNNLGHEKMEMKIGNHMVRHAHNNWIQVGYTYGVFAMMFYGILTFICLAFALKFYFTEHHKLASHSFLPLAVIVGFLVATMTECILTPFELFPAFAFWFVCCDLFIKKVPKNRCECVNEE